MSTSTPPSGPARPRAAGGRTQGGRAKWAAWAGVALMGLLVAGPSADRADAKLPAKDATAGLSLIASYALSLSEPSDLALDGSGESLWTVTDRPGKVHQLALDGTLIQTLKFVGEDLEGIAYDASDRTLWVAEENLRTNAFVRRVDPLHAVAGREIDELVDVEAAPELAKTHVSKSGIDVEGLELRERSEPMARSDHSDLA